MSQPLIKPQQAGAPASPSRGASLGSTARAVLRGVARGLCYERGGFQAAELWLLDDTSRELRLASRWARKGSALADKPSADRRALADAPADVAALSGGAVVLEDRAEGAAWDLHARAAGAAVAVPVSSDTTIHGVLWLLAEDAMTISDQPVELAEVVAGRLALEVEKASAGAGRGAAPTPAPEPVANTPAPVIGVPTAAAVPPVDSAGWSAQHAGGLAASGCYELADGRLLALSAAAIDSPESSAATQRAAVEWLMDEAPLVAARSEDAGILLTLLNRRIQESPLAGEGLAVAAALVEPPEDAEAGLGGVGTYAIAGPTVALSVRASATETHAGDLVPLGWTEPQAAYAPRPFELAVRQRLVLVAGDPRLTSPLAERQLGDVFRAATADAHREMTAEGCLRRLAGSGGDDAFAAVALRRD